MNTSETGFTPSLLVCDPQTNAWRIEEPGTLFAGKTADERPVWQFMREEEMISEGTAAVLHDHLLTGDTIYSARLSVENRRGQEYDCHVTLTRIPTTGEICFIIDRYHERTDPEGYDDMTGLRDWSAYIRQADRMIENDPEGIRNGLYAAVYLDVQRFKAVNDIFGKDAGDRLLRFIGERIRACVGEHGVGCHIDSDRFAFFIYDPGKTIAEQTEALLTAISNFDLAIEITANAGIFVSNEEPLTADQMTDRAVLAENTIKGRYTERMCFYTESLRDKLLLEQTLSGSMATAIQNRQFVVYYQPQYNHSTGLLVGAEALSRWVHPDYGMVSPSKYIPLFERNGFITRLDMYVYEEACAFLRRCMDKQIHVVPISVNMTRYDFFMPDFIEKLEKYRQKYDVPAKLLRLEITESVFVNSTERINAIIEKLHRLGYVIEMDDFGSGYSTLNMLKEIDMDIIKLDLEFVRGGMKNRGGTILSSVVRMAQRLRMPVLAEGVEDIEQADFLRSIGCDYIQGNLFGRPIPEEEFEKRLSVAAIAEMMPHYKLIEHVDPEKFYDPQSLETLIFSNLVGGAAIFEFRGNKTEMLRVNRKYLVETGMNISEQDLLQTDMLTFMDEENRKVYLDMLQRAISSGDEEECEVWRTLKSGCCGEDTLCIRSDVRLIGRSSDSYLFYEMIRNVTAEKRLVSEITDRERLFKAASEQANIYYWEYIIATKEMHPCFRCMRDLGLPAVVMNYPEPAIERGIFPPDYADMYRDWHRQLAAGVPSLEAVIPLTVGRVPFHVRYNTEFDETGRPVKAYGSATLVVD